MNLTRRILEGIQEVELQVTPEFRKLHSIENLQDALIENGWEGEMATATETPNVVTRLWTHSDIPRATIKVTYDRKTGKIVGRRFWMDKGYGEKPMWWPAIPGSVNDATPIWKDEAARKGGTGDAEGGAAASMGWGEPKRLSWSGQPRLDYEWKGKALVRGVRAEAHPSRVYAVSWPKSSVGLKGHWGDALRAIKKFDGWDKVYVYGVDDQVGANEFNKLIMEGVVEAWFVPNETGASEYDGNVADMLGEYIGHVEKPGGEAQ